MENTAQKTLAINQTLRRLPQQSFRAAILRHVQCWFEVRHNLLGIGSQPNNQQGHQNPVNRFASYKWFSFAKTDALCGQPMPEITPFLNHFPGRTKPFMPTMPLNMAAAVLRLSALKTTHPITTATKVINTDNVCIDFDGGLCQKRLCNKCQPWLITR
jgi:hypothetical protein